MAIKTINGFSGKSTAISFNMTPVIDIVFLLIIFFSLVFKFIEAENFPVTVPAGCEFAQNEKESQMAVNTITVMKGQSAICDFAIGAEKITGSNYGAIAEKLAGRIDSRLKDLPAENRIITLRIDKDIPFSEAQYALAAIAKSTANDIRLAVIKEEAGPE